MEREDSFGPAERVPARSTSVVGSAIGGALFGGFIGYGFLSLLLSYETAKAIAAQFGLSLARADERRFDAVLGATVFGILGIVTGIRQRKRKAKRVAGIQRAASTLGAAPPTESDSGLAGELEAFFPRARMLRVENVIHAALQGIDVATGDVSFETSSGTGTGTHANRQTRTVSQTVACYHSGTRRFPRFTLQPEGFLLNLLSGTVGVEDIDFPSHPDFSAAYHLTAVHAENTRALFNGRLLDGLSRRRGLHVESDEGRLILYRPDTICAADELAAFAVEAADVFRLFEDAAKAIAAVPAPAAPGRAAPAPKTDVRALAAKMPGLMGWIIRKNLVTREDVDAFVAQPTPRKMPGKILKYRDQVAPDMAIGLGFAFTLAGAFFGYVVAIEGVYTRGVKINTVAGMILPGLFVLIGSAMTFAVVRQRIRITRLMRRGRLCEANVVSIDKTDSSSGDETLWAMTVEFDAESGPVRTSFKLTKHALVRARRLLRERRPARILYDPSDPRRIIYTDALMQVSPEYD